MAVRRRESRQPSGQLNCSILTLPAGHCLHSVGQCGHFVPALIAMGQMPPPRSIQRAGGNPLVSQQGRSLDLRVVKASAQANFLLSQWWVLLTISVKENIVRLTFNGTIVAELSWLMS